MSRTEEFELIIVGGGPAGLCAAMYAGRGMLKAVLLERGIPGGELLNTEWIDDYPGFEHVLGRELAHKMAAHARTFGADIRQENVESISRREDGIFEVATTGGTTYEAPAVILTAGGTPTKLERPGRAGVRRPRRVLLRRLRWRVLQGRDHRGRRRRRCGGRGGRLSHPVRDQGLRDPSARRVPRVQDPAGAAVRQSQDRGDLEPPGAGAEGRAVRSARPGAGGHGDRASGRCCA